MITTVDIIRLCNELDLPKTIYLTLLLWMLLFFTGKSTALYDPGLISDQPYFMEPMENTTVRVGQTAKFQCMIGNLKNRKIAWIRKDKHIILALGDTAIYKNSRISAGNHSSKIFYIQIHNVKEEDRGEYMCQVNSAQVIRQSAFLDVNVAPTFIEELTSSDTDVNEGEQISVRCAAKGFPPPKIEWRREDKESIVTFGSSMDVESDSHNVTNKKVQGEFLNMSSINRLQMGAYLCIASNGIPNSVSKRIFIGVNFSPMVWTPHQMIGAPLDGEASLMCTVDAYPTPDTYWLRAKNRQVIVSSSKYSINTVQTGSYKFEMHLNIHHVQSSDFGGYVCVAKNLLNEASGKIALYEVPKPVRFVPPRPSNRPRTNILDKSSALGEKKPTKHDDKKDKLNIASFLTNSLNSKKPSQEITKQSETEDGQSSKEDLQESSEPNSGHLTCLTNPNLLGLLLLVLIVARRWANDLGQDLMLRF